jgi:5-deoxy-glucuronate isomerase
MQHLYFPKPPITADVTEIVRPKPGTLTFLSIKLLCMHEGGEYNFSTGDQEAVLDIFSGVCTVYTQSVHGMGSWQEIGGRTGVFEGPPTMVYIPRDSSVRIIAESDFLEAALVLASARQGFPPALVTPSDCVTKVVGRDNWQRTVYTGIGGNTAADRLIVGETVNPPGNWSSAPPHKHDTLQGSEVPMEEIYHYRLNPPQGFALQRIYTDPEASDGFDVTYAVKDGDTVAIPRGYHPVAAAPGYQLFYLWALAGEQRGYGAWTDDPAHAWIKGV